MKRQIKSALQQLRFNLSANDSLLFRVNYKYFYTPKKGSLSEFLSEYSKNIGDTFTVIQIGANDGITHDPIHKFIKRDRWNGVLLEPQRYVFDKYLSKIYHKHPNITVLNAALGEQDGQAKIYKIGFSKARWATGLTTFDKSTLEKAFETGHVQRKCEKEGVKIPADKRQHIVEEEVEIISVKSLLERHKIDQIDLLMIDTEGFDFEIIKLFDIGKTAPGAIVFEHSHLSETDYTACIDLLQKYDYVVRKDGANTAAIKINRNQYPAYFSE